MKCISGCRMKLIAQSGGYIVGYQHDITKNVSLEKISHPFSGDYCNRIHFTIKDPRHNSFLLKEEVKKAIIWEYGILIHRMYLYHLL